MKYLILTFLLTLTLGRVVAQDCANFLEFDVITVPHESDPCLMTTKIVFHTPDEQYFDIGSFEFEFELSAEVDNIQCNFGFSVDFCPSGTDDRIFFEHDSPISSEELECDQCEDDFPNVNPEFNFISFDHSFDQCIDFEFWDGTFDDGTGNNNSRCIRPSDRILNEDYCEEEFEFDGYTVCIEITSDDENCTLPDTEVIGNNTCGTTNLVLTNAEGEACVPVPEGGCTEIEVDCPCVFNDAVNILDLQAIQRYINRSGTLDPLAVILANVGSCISEGSDPNAIDGIDLVELQKLILNLYTEDQLAEFGCNLCLTLDPRVVADFDPTIDAIIPPYGPIEICEGDDPVSVISAVLGDVDLSCSPECGMKRLQSDYNSQELDSSIELVKSGSKLLASSSIMAYSLMLNLKVTKHTNIEDIEVKNFGSKVVQEVSIVDDRLVVLVQAMGDAPFSLQKNEVILNIKGMKKLAFHNDYAAYNRMFISDKYRKIELADLIHSQDLTNNIIHVSSQTDFIELNGDLSMYDKVDIYDMMGRKLAEIDIPESEVELVEILLDKQEQILNLILRGEKDKQIKVFH